MRRFPESGGTERGRRGAAREGPARSEPADSAGVPKPWAAMLTGPCCVDSVSAADAPCTSREGIAEEQRACPQTPELCICCAAPSRRVMPAMPHPAASGITAAARGALWEQPEITARAPQESSQTDATEETASRSTATRVAKMALCRIGFSVSDQHSAPGAAGKPASSDSA